MKLQEVSIHPVTSLADEIAEDGPLPEDTQENILDHETGNAYGDQIRNLEKKRSILENLVFEKDVEKFMNVNTEKIARELAIMDWNAYKNITIKDIQLASSSSTSEKIQKFNLNYQRMYYWTLETILSGKDAETVTVLIQKFIKIADALINRNNFNLSHSIVQGLLSYPIQRLEKSWKNISNNKLKTLNFLKNIFDKNVDYLILTEKMEDAYAINNICVPYFDLFLEEFRDVFNNSQSGLKAYTLRRVDVIVEDLKKLSKFQNAGISVTSGSYRWIDSLQISQERIEIIQKEAVNRSHTLEPVKRCYKILNIVDRRSLFKIQRETSAEKLNINSKRRISKDDSQDYAQLKFLQEYFQ